MKLKNIKFNPISDLFFDVFKIKFISINKKMSAVMVIKEKFNQALISKKLLLPVYTGRFT